MAKKRFDTVEGAYDPHMSGEHVYQNEDGSQSIITQADDHGLVSVTVEWLDIVLSKEGFVRV